MSETFKTQAQKDAAIKAQQAVVDNANASTVEAEKAELAEIKAATVVA